MYVFGARGRTWHYHKDNRLTSSKTYPFEKKVVILSTCHKVLVRIYNSDEIVDKILLLNSTPFILLLVVHTFDYGFLKSVTLMVGHMSLNDFWRLSWGHGLIQIKIWLIKKNLRYRISLNNVLPYIMSSLE